MRRALLPLAGITFLTACGQKPQGGPWLTMPDLATHSALYFPVNLSDVHGPPAGQPLDCNACHADPSGAPSASFRTYTCIGCHVQTGAGYHDDPVGLTSFHSSQSVANFQFASSACLQCHPEGTGIPPPYHPQLFPVDRGSKHAGIGCASCHGANRADVTQLGCVTCHSDAMKGPTYPAQHTVSGYGILVQIVPPTCTTTVALPALTIQDCLNCHALAQVTLVSAHPGGETAFGNGRHQGAGCYTCHVSTKQVTANVTPALSGYPTIDFTQPSPASQSSTGCAKCHSNGCGGG
jgi:hypothetical protein